MTNIYFTNQEYISVRESIDYIQVIISRGTIWISVTDSVTQNKYIINVNKIAYITEQ